MQCRHYYVIFGKEDIKKDCKFCQKTERKSILSDTAYGYECIIKNRKRKMNRCRWCYSGIVISGIKNSQIPYKDIHINIKQKGLWLVKL